MLLLRALDHFWCCFWLTEFTTEGQNYEITAKITDRPGTVLSSNERKTDDNKKQWTTKPLRGRQ